MSDSRSIILGVVPELTRAWNPDSAPHMITMHTNGQTVPGTTGPSPLMKGVAAGIFNSGMGHENAHRQHHDHPDLHVRAEVAPRAEQHPDRQDGGDRRVDRQDDRQRRLAEDSR